MRTESIEIYPPRPARVVIIAAFVALLLLATAYFATTVARELERPDNIPIHWSGDLAV